MPAWSSTADWDAGQSETGVHHEQPAGTNWAASSTLEKGLPAQPAGYSMNVLAYYPLAESSGATTMYDVSGQGTDGTYNGPTQQAGGPLGGNYRTFDGSSAYADCGQDYAPSAMLGCTAWVRVDTWTNSWAAVMSSVDGNRTDEWSVQRDGNADTLRFYIDDTEVCQLSGVNFAGTGWRHIHFQHDGSVAEAYVDGGLVESNSSSALSYGGAGVTHDIGRSPLGADYWSGDIAHVIVWGGGSSESLLTESEVNDLYQAFV